MGEHHFGLHHGFLTARADRIAKRHGASHTNYDDNGQRRRGWFSCPNMGEPFDSATARAVLDDIEKAGGFEALRHKADRQNNY